MNSWAANADGFGELFGELPSRGRSDRQPIGRLGAHAVVRRRRIACSQFVGGLDPSGRHVDVRLGQLAQQVVVGQDGDGSSSRSRSSGARSTADARPCTVTVTRSCWVLTRLTTSDRWAFASANDIVDMVLSMTRTEWACPCPEGRAPCPEHVTRGSGGSLGIVDGVSRFRRLARSSPWLWRSVRFGFDDGSVSVRAWVRRPHALRVESLAGEVLVASAGRLVPGGIGLYGPGLGVGEPAAPMWWTDPRAPVPDRDAEGLVSQPVSLPLMVVVDDPIWRNYRWVSMLNPRELSDGLDGGPADTGRRAGRGAAARARHGVGDRAALRRL